MENVLYCLKKYRSSPAQIGQRGEGLWTFHKRAMMDGPFS